MLQVLWFQRERERDKESDASASEIMGSGSFKDRDQGSFTFILHLIGTRSLGMRKLFNCEYMSAVEVDGHVLITHLSGHRGSCQLQAVWHKARPFILV